MSKIEQITTLEELYKSGGAKTGNVFVDGMVEFLQSTKSLQVSEAAEFLGISPRLLTDTIKLFVGVMPKEMIPRWRVMQALDLMDANPEMKREEVAQACGFSLRGLEVNMQKHYGTTIDAYHLGKTRRNDTYFTDSSARVGVRRILENAQKLKKR